MPSGATPKVYPSALVERVRALYAEGHTQDEIAEIVGSSQKVVWRLMYRHGIETRVAAKRDQRGEKNSNWRGQDIGYSGAHVRVAAARGEPKTCEVCGTNDPSKSYDWANLTGRYHDPSDYKRMCRSCHWRFDGKILNIRRMRKGVENASA